MINDPVDHSSIWEERKELSQQWCQEAIDLSVQVEAQHGESEEEEEEKEEEQVFFHRHSCWIIRWEYLKFLS